MNAIAGRIDFGDSAAAPQARLVVEAMCERMKRRAPDGRELQAVRHGWLGVGWLHSTLTAVRGATNAGHDPELIVVADARIDNTEEIFDACELDEQTRRCAGDADAIRMAYRRFGAAAARHLRGDFAFALWDTRTSELYCARDPLGVRQLHYCARGEVLWLATEPPALFADPELVARPNLRSIALYIAQEYTDNGDTLLEGVTSLPPGHCLRARRGHVRLERYWQPDPFARLAPAGDEEYAAMFEDAFARSVRRRVRSSTPLAVQISGGMDSSSVACEIERQRRAGHGPSARPTLLHMTFPGLDCDETRFSRAVGVRWELPMLEIDGLARTDLTAPARAAEWGRPSYFPGAYAFEGLLEQAAARGIRTVATGEGGDMCLRTTHQELAEAFANGRWREVARRTLRPPWAPSSWRRALQVTARQLVPWRLRRAVGPLRRPLADPLLTPRWGALVEEHRLERAIAWEQQSFPDRPTRVLFRALHESAVQRALGRLDRLAGAHGVQLVHPFFDLDVIELLLAMPHAQRHVPLLRKPKPVLRRAMRQALPPLVYRRTGAAEYSSFLRASLFGHHELATRALLRRGELVRLGVSTRAALDSVGKTSDPALLHRMLNLTAMELWLGQLTP